MREDDAVVRRKRANEVRLNAIREKTRKAEILQAQIKESIQGLDERVKKATHIQFSDSDDEVEKEAPTNGKDNLENSLNSKADTLLGFSGSDSGDEVNIDLKPQFEGKEGEKLLELQSSYGNDARFRLDKRFAEDDSSSSGDDEAGMVEDEEENARREVERNLQLLNQVMGRDVASTEQTKKRIGKFIDVSSRRYDPSKDTHLELKVDKTVTAKPNKKKKRKNESENIETDSRKYFEMSTHALRDAFASKSEEDASTTGKEDQPFFFLSMLGRADEETGRGDVSRKTIQEIDQVDLASTKREIPAPEKKLRYDSSETEDDEEMEGENITDNKTDKRESKIEGLSIKHQLSSFFLASKSDPRIVDGAKEFCWNKPFKQVQQEWMEVKDTLIKDYKKKHRDAKRKQRRAKYEARMLSINSDT